MSASPNLHPSHSETGHETSPTTPNNDSAPPTQLPRPIAPPSQRIPAFSELLDIRRVINAEHKYGYHFHDYQNSLTWAQANLDEGGEQSQGSFIRFRTAHTQLQMVEQGVDELLKEAIPEGRKPFATFLWNYDHYGNLKESPHITEQPWKSWRRGTMWSQD